MKNGTFSAKTAPPPLKKRCALKTAQTSLAKPAHYPPPPPPPPPTLPDSPFECQFGSIQ